MTNEPTPDGAMVAALAMLLVQRPGPVRKERSVCKCGRRYAALDGLCEYCSIGSPPPSEQTEAVVGRNQPCPCGSGRKFKACHRRS